MTIGLPCDFVASNSSIIGLANKAAYGTLLQRPLSGDQFRSANGRFWPNADSQPTSTAFHIKPGGFMNAGTGRAAARSQFAMAPTTERTAGRCVIRSRHSRSLGVAAVTGAL
jgi:hypothetical protein